MTKDELNKYEITNASFKKCDLDKSQILQVIDRLESAINHYDDLVHLITDRLFMVTIPVMPMCEKDCESKLSVPLAKTLDILTTKLSCLNDILQDLNNRIEL